MKRVIGLEALLGKKYAFGNGGHWVAEYYLGLGVRLKLRDITINEQQNGGLNFYPVIPYTEKTNSFLATGHIGFKIGFSF